MSLPDVPIDAPPPSGPPLEMPLQVAAEATDGAERKVLATRDPSGGRHRA